MRKKLYLRYWFGKTATGEDFFANTPTLFWQIEDIKGELPNYEFFSRKQIREIINREYWRVIDRRMLLAGKL